MSVFKVGDVVYRVSMSDSGACYRLSKGEVVAVADGRRYVVSSDTETGLPAISLLAGDWHHTPTEAALTHRWNLAAGFQEKLQQLNRLVGAPSRRVVLIVDPIHVCHAVLVDGHLAYGDTFGEANYYNQRHSARELAEKFARYLGEPGIEELRAPPRDELVSADNRAYWSRAAEQWYRRKSLTPA